MKEEERRKKIGRVERGSIADELGVKAGDVLLEMNGRAVVDVFDYKPLVASEYVELLVESGGQQTVYEIEKVADEDLGLVFETWLMDKPRCCRNKCIFCFIDQMPPGMRKSLYFKDDDVRLSFISGNYVTLTNIGCKELKRLISHRLSPVNISVHATNPRVRAFMLGGAGRRQTPALQKQLDMLKRGGIDMNFQIVLCKGVNDGAVLDETITALAAYMPQAKSLSVVPAGITRYRQGLFPLKPFSAKDAAAVIRQTEKHGERFKRKYGTRFVYPSDEFFLTAKIPLPNVGYYEGFPQLKNGVGMGSLFLAEVRRTRRDLARCCGRGAKPKREATHNTIATGVLAYPLVKHVVKGLNINVVAVKNKFFGQTVTVSGLVTGGDLIEQLSGTDLGERLLIPANMLKADEQVFLDGVTLEEVKQRLGVEVVVV